MYQVGEKINYGAHGVCTISDIEIRSIDRKKIPYFVLEPIEQPGARYYLPKDNPAALAKITPILTPQQLDDLLVSCVVPDCLWIQDENRRKQQYRELLCSGDRRSLIMMVKGLHLHRKNQEEMGKKFHLCDESILRDAEKLLCGEFSLVLGKTKEETALYLRQFFQEKYKDIT